MRKLFLFLGFILLFYFSYGFYLATFEIKLFDNPRATRMNELFYDYRGVTHVVTSYSKGSSAPPDILIEAASANLSYLFFTDLNLIERPYDLAGYQGNVFTFSSQKLSYLDSHVLVYSENPDFYIDSMSAAHAQLHQHFSEPPSPEKSFITVLAHPFKPQHQWTGDYPIGLDGIEVINMRHLWQELWFHDKPNFIWSLFTYPWNPQLSLLRLIKDPRRELDLWDFLNKQKPTLGFLGNQTTAKIFRLLGLNFTFPSYERSFNFGSNHILLPSELTGHVESDRKKIFQSIRKGHFYFAFDALGSPSGFATFMQQGEKNHLMGSQLKLSRDLKLVVELPEGLIIPSTIEVFKDGVLFFQSQEHKVSLPVKEAGNYRVVVKIQPQLPLPDSEKRFGWIYSNPFFVQP